MRHLLRLSLFVIFTPLVFAGCTKDHLLPDATSDGRNTFGFKVNGKVWIPDGTPAGKNPAMKPITIEFSRVKADTFSIAIYASASTMDRVQLTLPKATLGINQLTDSRQYATPSFAIYYDDINYRHFYQYGVNPGKVVITRLDTLAGVISGTFEFEGQEILKKQTVSITEGRFDLNIKSLN